MEIKSLDKRGIDFLIAEEGLRLKAYKDSVGVWTIAVGCTYYHGGEKVKEGDVLTHDEAINLFKEVLKHYELSVYSLTRDDISQNQFNALVSLCFNIGVGAFKNSTVLRLVNANPNDPNIGGGFLLWKRAGGKMILLGRRRRESDLYFS